MALCACQVLPLLLQGQNLLVPIHAYPMLNHTQFPKRVDFGRCALGTRSSRHITMQCRIPIEFEFEVSWGHSVTAACPMCCSTSEHSSPSGAQAVSSNIAAAQQWQPESMHCMSDDHLNHTCCTDECLLHPLRLSISGSRW